MRYNNSDVRYMDDMRFTSGFLNVYMCTLVQKRWRPSSVNDAQRTYCLPIMLEFGMEAIVKKTVRQTIGICCNRRYVPEKA